jgi:hypothetical protein
LVRFYRRLTAVAPQVRCGRWALLDAAGWPDNRTHQDLLAWAWHDDLPHHVVVVNLAGHASQGRVTLSWNALLGRQWRLTDVVLDRVYDRDGDELARQGLYIDLPPWAAHVLRLEAR